MELSRHTLDSFEAHWCATTHSLGNPAPVNQLSVTELS